jgi:hypothetical protein
MRIFKRNSAHVILSGKIKTVFVTRKKEDGEKIESDYETNLNYMQL